MNMKSALRDISHPPAVIAFTTLLHNPQPAQKRRAEPLPAKGGRPPLAFENTAFRRSDIIKLPSEPARFVGGTLDAQGRRPGGGLNLGAKGA